MKITNLFIIILFCLFNFCKLISLDYVLLKNIESFNKLIMLEPIFSNNEYTYFNFQSFTNKIIKTNQNFSILKQIDSIDFKNDTINNIPIVQKITPNKVLYNKNNGEYYLMNFSKSKYLYKETLDGFIKTDPLPGSSSIILYANFLTNGELLLIKPDSIFFVEEDVQSYKFNIEERTQVYDFKNFFVNCEDTLFYLNKYQEIVRYIKDDYKVYSKLLFTNNTTSTFFSNFVVNGNSLLTSLCSSSGREAKLIEMNSDSFTIEDLTTSNKPAEKLEIPFIKKILADNYGNVIILISDIKNYGPISLWIRTNKIWKEIKLDEIVKSESLVFMDRLYNIDNRILIPVNNEKKDSVFFLVIDPKVLRVEESLARSMPGFYIDNIYPNPIKKYAFIEFSCSNLSFNTTKVKIYNNLGISLDKFDYKVIYYDYVTGKGLIQVDVSKLINGHYFLIFDDGNHIKSKSIIIKQH